MSKYEVATCTVTVPSSFSISPRMADTREDLPAPTCPTTATSLPLGISRSILQSNVKPGQGQSCSQMSSWVKVNPAVKCQGRSRSILKSCQARSRSILKSNVKPGQDQSWSQTLSHVNLNPKSNIKRCQGQSWSKRSS